MCSRDGVGQCVTEWVNDPRTTSYWTATSLLAGNSDLCVGGGQDLRGVITLINTPSVTSCLSPDVQSNSTYNLWLGLTLALLSAFLIGGSVILKKKALLRLANNGHTRAGEQSQVFLMFDLGGLSGLSPDAISVHGKNTCGFIQS